MLLRRSRFARPLAGAAIVLTLTSCGFNYATDAVYTPAVGVNNRDGSVDVLNAVIVSTEAGEGTFIATLSNNDTEKAGQMVGLAGAGADEALEAELEAPLSVEPGAFLNLADDEGVKVAGERVKAGNFVSVVVSFGDGFQAKMKIPVVPNKGDFADLDGPAPVEDEPAEDEAH